MSEIRLDVKVTINGQVFKGRDVFDADPGQGWKEATDLWIGAVVGSLKKALQNEGLGSRIKAEEMTLEKRVPIITEEKVATPAEDKDAPKPNIGGNTDQGETRVSGDIAVESAIPDGDAVRRSNSEY